MVLCYIVFESENKVYTVNHIDTSKIGHIADQVVSMML